MKRRKDSLTRELRASLDQRDSHLLERQSLLYFLHESEDGQQDLFCLDPRQNAGKRLVLSGRRFRERDARILSFTLSPDASALALQVKELFKSAPDYHLFALPVKTAPGPSPAEATAVLERASYLLFLDEERFCYGHIPDLNDASDCAALYAGRLTEPGQPEILLKAEDAFEIQPYLPQDRRELWVRVLRDYYENDELFLWEEKPRAFRCVVPEGNGRCVYLGTWEAFHLLLCSLGSDHFQLIALRRDQPLWEERLSLLAEEENRARFTQSLHQLPAALLRGDQLLYFCDGHVPPQGERAGSGQSPLLLHLPSRTWTDLAEREPAYFANQETLPESDCADAFYFFCEPLFQAATIWRVDRKHLAVTKISLREPLSKISEPVQFDRYSFEDTEMRVFRPDKGKISGGILHLSADATCDLLLRESLYNYRSCLRPWMHDGLYAELDLGRFSAADTEQVFRLIDRALTVLRESYALPPQTLFLFESGFLNSFSLGYAYSFPDKIGGAAVYNLRTDFLRYEEDACGYMVRDLIGTAAAEEGRQRLRACSPLEIARNNARKAARLPVLLLCNEDNILVPDVHSERLAQLLREADPQSQTRLERISEQEETALYAALLDFFFTERERRKGRQWSL